jgi:uncharacterized protein YndB with AHSA1/START domain
MAAARIARARRPTLRKTAVKKRPAVRRKLAAAPKGNAAARAGRGVNGTALRLAGVGSEAVLKATGRAWDEWLKVLDRAGAKALPHKDIALLLSRKFEVPDWWSQMVTVGYEQARGLRLPYPHAEGFSANASKTLHAGLDALFAAWAEPRQRARWLPDARLEVRRATGGKSMRMTWSPGGSSVDVGFVSKGAGKCVVQVQHSNLRDAAAAARQKAYWGDALGRLKALLEPR